MLFVKRTFSETVELLCKHRGGDFYQHNRINQSAVANAAGTSQPTVSRWLSEVHKPDLVQLEMLASAFRVNVSQLIGELPIMRIDGGTTRISQEDEQFFQNYLSADTEVKQLLRDQLQTLKQLISKYSG
ncbi:MAG TPA: helix-turn-helix transcriptional regulator [Acidovorax sp.]|nr:helix-turn-helix transcriptional regulator [Acidovorax sp.]